MDLFFNLLTKMSEEYYMSYFVIITIISVIISYYNDSDFISYLNLFIYVQTLLLCLLIYDYEKCRPVFIKK